jgi:hypothetical protein
VDRTGVELTICYAGHAQGNGSATCERIPVRARLDADQVVIGPAFLANDRYSDRRHGRVTGALSQVES